MWLGWFLCRLVADFAPAGARARRRRARAALGTGRHGWRAALNGPAWDGQWFKRAFFDDGQPLGSQANAECRIDLIAQAWAVLSGAAPPALQRMALAAVEAHLVDHDAGLMKLLDPPLAHAQPSAGYIQAYPPGVRENGGQYSHAGVWALMAQAKFHSQLAKANSGAAPDHDIAYRYFSYLSPAHRAATRTRGAAYGIEPYVMAGDVYTPAALCRARRLELVHRRGGVDAPRGHRVDLRPAAGRARAVLQALPALALAARRTDA